MSLLKVNREDAVVCGLPPSVRLWQDLFGWHFVRVPGRSSLLYCSLATVQPEHAACLLANHNDKNRPRSRAHVRTLSRAISEGHWRLTGQPLILSDEGRVLDCQHRLQAIADAGVPIEALVVANVQQVAFDSIDLGRRRSLNDMLTIAGSQQGKALSAAVPFMMNYLATGIFTRSGLRPPDRLMYRQIEFVAEHPGLSDSAEFVSSYPSKRVRILRNLGLAVALHYVFKRAVPEMAEDFLRRLLEWQVPSEPIYGPLQELFATLIDNLHNTRITTERVAAYVVKTWNAMCQGQATVVLRFGDKESFPKVITAASVDRATKAAARDNDDF